MSRFARKVAKDAVTIEVTDVERLKGDDADVFDIAAMLMHELEP